MTGQIVPTNPAAAVRGPRHVVKAGAAPVLEGAEWRKLLASVPATTLRDLALIATLTLFLCRDQLCLEDEGQGCAAARRRLHENGGKQHAMRRHHALAEALRAYIDVAGIAEDRKAAVSYRASAQLQRVVRQSDDPLSDA